MNAWRNWAGGVGVVVITFALFARVGGHEFISYDDPDYVTENVNVRGGLSAAGVAWALTAGDACNWHPLTWISHMTDVSLFGMNAGGHHLVNVLFHSVNAGILFLLLRSMTGAYWRSLLVSVLFAWHPLRIESVAWVSERKDVLSAFFGFLAIAAYVRYTRRKGAGGYVLSVALAACSLMAKPMFVTLPFVLLLLDYWPLKRMGRGGVGVRRLVAEKGPFLVLSVVSSVVTFIVQQRSGAMRDTVAAPVGARVANACVAYGEYLVKMVWPGNLAVFYPYRAELPVGEVAVAAVVLVGLTAAVAMWRARPYVTAGWLWYLGTLVPVIGLVQVGSQSMADRYTYVTQIGLYIIIAWGLKDLGERLAWVRRIGPAVAGGAVVALAVGTFVQLGYWKNTASLFEHALATTSDNWIAHGHLARVLSKEGKAEEADRHFAEAIRINPAYPQGHYNWGNSLLKQNRPVEAISHYRAALRINPDLAEANMNLGALLVRGGRVEEAEWCFREARRAKPGFPEAHCSLGIINLQQGRVEEAGQCFTEALRLRPGYEKAREGLAAVESARRSGSRGSGKQE